MSVVRAGDDNIVLEACCSQRHGLFTGHVRSSVGKVLRVCAGSVQSFRGMRRVMSTFLALVIILAYHAPSTCFFLL